MRALTSVLCALLIAAAARGQQTGDPNRDYVINGAGAGGTSVVPSVLGVPALFANVYATQDPGMPVLWLGSAVANPGQLMTGANSVDLGSAPGFADVVELGNGAQPGWPGLLFQTLGDGSFQVAVTAPAALAGVSFHFMMAHYSPSSVDGVYVSQVHLVSFAQDPNLGLGNPTCTMGATSLVLGDDAFAQQTLGFSFPFYGTQHSDLYVGSNGYVTFTSGDTSLSESVPTFLSQQPRIAAWWDDLDPSAGGTVSFFTDNQSLAEICVQQVPEFSQITTNTFKVTLISSPPNVLITLDYGAMAAIDGLVGLSPGNGIDPVGLPLNLSLGGTTLGANQAVYELFDASNPNDLSNLQVNWFLDATGQPTMQF